MTDGTFSEKFSIKLGLYLFLCFGLVFVSFWGCNHPPYFPTPIPTSTSTPTYTPTMVSTPGCGYTAVSVPTPVTGIPSYTFTSTVNFGFGDIVPGDNYVIRNLSDWKNYYGSTSAPAPPITFGSQMLLINLQNYTPGDSTFVNGVCWTTTGITVTCMLETGTVPIPISLTPGATPVPIPTPTTGYINAVVVPLSNLPVTWLYTQQLNAE